MRAVCNLSGNVCITVLFDSRPGPDQPNEERERCVSESRRSWKCTRWGAVPCQAVSTIESQNRTLLHTASVSVYPITPRASQCLQIGLITVRYNNKESSIDSVIIVTVQLWGRATAVRIKRNPYPERLLLLLLLWKGSAIV